MKKILFAVIIATIFIFLIFLFSKGTTLSPETENSEDVSSTSGPVFKDVFIQSDFIIKSLDIEGDNINIYLVERNFGDLGFNKQDLANPSPASPQVQALAQQRPITGFACTSPVELTPPLPNSFVQINSQDQIDNKGRYIVFIEIDFASPFISILRGYDMGPDEIYGTSDDLGAVTLNPVVPQWNLFSEMSPVVNRNGVVFFTRINNNNPNCALWVKELVRCQFGPGNTCQNTEQVIKTLNSNQLCVASQIGVSKSVTDTQLIYTFSDTSNAPNTFQVNGVEIYDIASGSISRVITTPNTPAGFFIPIEVIFDSLTNAFVWKTAIFPFPLGTTPPYVDTWFKAPSFSNPVQVHTFQLGFATGPPGVGNVAQGTLFYDSVRREYVYISGEVTAPQTYINLNYTVFSNSGRAIKNSVVSVPGTNRHATNPLAVYSSLLNSPLLAFSIYDFNGQTSEHMYYYDSATRSFRLYGAIPTSSIPIIPEFESFSYPNLFLTTDYRTTAGNPERILVSVCS